MKRQEKKTSGAFEQAHRLMQHEIEEVGARVLERLRAPDECTEVAEAPRPSLHPAWRFAAVTGALAATLMTAVVILRVVLSPPTLAEASDSGLDAIAVGESLKAGQHLSTQAGAVLKLADGSRVEMRSHSELSLERADDGLRIQLSRGGVIVNAAKQGAGHLYVQTKEVTVSVVGTVFLVNAEETGSRVAVIEGEVRVKQGTDTKKLRSGDDLSTNPILAGPVRDALSWSRNAESHLALLQQTTASTPQGTRFENVSIRPMDPPARGPATLGADTESRGFGCHGVDATLRAYWRSGLEIPIPQGRCVGNGVPLMTLVNYAYGTPWRFGSGIPEWARVDIDCEDAGREHSCFQITAAADKPETTTIAQLRAMLQTMLAERFNLQVHRETQNVQAYVFHVAKNGPKLKEYTGDTEPPKLTPGVGLNGKTSLDELARFLTDFVVVFAHLGNIDTPFINRTGLTGTYDYAFRLRPGGGGARGGGDPNAGPPSRELRLSQLADDMSVTMEERLGLRLDTEKLPIEVLILDHVERPSEN